MSLCDTCPLDEKLHRCCGRHPMTGERVPLRLADGTVVLACPFLDARGRCTAYDARPQGCARYVCEEYARSGTLPLPDFFLPFMSGAKRE
jgi:Fe-S-cluster containining protein